MSCRQGDLVKEVAVPWSGVALVCRKCSRKLKGGFGKKGKVALAKELRGTLREAGRRRALRVLEVGCLGVCPKRGVTVVSGAGRVFVVLEGAPAAEVLGVLERSWLRLTHL